MFYTLRQIEVWLHQHIFKLGWLLTNQLQTTTILYYAFFLPGIFLNQLVYWAAAGFLNVHAERKLVWPQKQEIGELKLDFVRLSPKIDALRLAVITSAPLVVGMALVWYIAYNILRVPTFLSMIQGGFLDDISAALRYLVSAPDFWIWVYLAFVVANTMMPNFEHLRGWRVVIAALGIIVAVLYALGIGNQVVANNLRGPITNAVNSLSTIFAIIIGLDMFAVAILGTCEAVFERITGDSATFKDGKMITLRRGEATPEATKQLPAPEKQSAKAASSGPPSVYKLPFPIPGAPGKEPVTRDEGLIITPDPALSLQPPARVTPTVVPGIVVDKPTVPAVKPPEAKPALPAATPDKPVIYEDVDESA